MARPHAACTSCYRRKLKCDRNPNGCGTCQKAVLPCIYVAAATSNSGNATVSKKPRGPYKKHRTAREVDLERAVEILQAKSDLLENRLEHAQSSDQEDAGSSTGNGTSSSHRARGLAYRQDHVTGARMRETIDAPSTASQATRDTPDDEDTNQRRDDGSAGTGCRSTTDQIMEYWYYYHARFDPIMKVVHQPSLLRQLLRSRASAEEYPKDLSLLWTCMCFAALTTMTDTEVTENLPVSRDNLLRQHKSTIDKSIAEVHHINTPTLRHLQALVIYLSCLRRLKSSGDNLPLIFGLAVRMAQLLGLHQDTAKEPSCESWLELEMRRRCWWALCRMECRYAEEFTLHSVSILDWAEVPLPMNLNDVDLHAHMKLSEPLQPRSGVTEATYLVIGVRLVKLIVKLRSLHVEGRASSSSSLMTTEATRISRIRQQQIQAVEECRLTIQYQYLDHCDISRPLDWLLLLASRLILTKAHIMLQGPLNPEQDSASGSRQTEQNTKDIFALTLDVLECDHQLHTEPRLQDFCWYYRNFVQWHALIYILKELSQFQGTVYFFRAWNILDKVLSDLDHLQQQQDADEYFGIVNTLYQRVRRDCPRPSGEAEPRTSAEISNTSRQRTGTAPEVDTAPVTSQPFHSHPEFGSQSMSVPSNNLGITQPGVWAQNPSDMVNTHIQTTTDDPVQSQMMSDLQFLDADLNLFNWYGDGFEYPAS